MGGADGVAGQLRGRALVEFFQVVCGFYGQVEEAAFACGPVMDAGCCHQVAHVVCLEVEAIFEGRGFSIMSFFYDGGGVDVAVGALGACDDGNGFIHETVEASVFRHGVDDGHAFEQLVKVAVVEGWAYMRPGVEARGNAKVGKGVADMRVGVDLPEGGDHGVADGGELVGPEAGGPLNVAEVDALQGGVAAVGGVYERSRGCGNPLRI